MRGVSLPRPHLDECTHLKQCTCDSTTEVPKGGYSNLCESSCKMRIVLIVYIRKFEVQKPLLMSAINFIFTFANLAHPILGHWEPTQALKRMKTYKPSFAQPNMCMRKGLRWHVMAHIRNGSPTK